MRADIRQAQTEEERQKVFCLRYQVYVTELKLDVAEADHKTRMVKSSLDEHAIILGSFIGDEVIGTITVNFGYKDLGPFIAFHEMEAFRPFFPEHSSMTTKLVVKREYRPGPTLVELVKAGYRASSQGGSLFDHVCFHPRQKILFEHLGYREVLPQLTLPGYGMSHRMVLVLRDKKHLSKVGSPFRRLVPQGDDCGTVEWFNQKFKVRQSRDF